MASNFWIKLYHEILHDPKMGMLPDNVWRRCLEIFLLAGELDNDGQLPDTQELAWLLRQGNIERFEAELEHLERVGILTRLTDGWLVTNFTKRQGVIDSAERSKAYRDRKRERGDASGPHVNEKSVTPASQESHEPINEPSRDSHAIVTQPVTQRDADIDIDKESSPKGDSGKPLEIFGESFPEQENHEPLTEPDSIPESPPEESQLKPAQAMFSTLAKVCRLDLGLLTDKDRGKLDSFEKRMRDKGYGPTDVSSFESWWYGHTWQGRDKDQAPTLDELYKHWGQYLAFLKGERGGGNPRNGAGPPARKGPPLVGEIDQEKLRKLQNGEL